MKLSPIQKIVLEDMEFNKWYDAFDLPLATGRTYLALEKKGLIETKQVAAFRGYTPIIWTYKFRKIAGVI